jgi:hypothetical protein
LLFVSVAGQSIQAYPGGFDGGGPTSIRRIAVDQNIIDLYDEYTHRPLERHAFVNRLATIAGGKAAAEGLLPTLESQPEHASVVNPNDERLETRVVTFTGQWRGDGIFCATEGW